MRARRQRTSMWSSERFRRAIQIHRQPAVRHTLEDLAFEVSIERKIVRKRYGTYLTDKCTHALSIQNDARRSSRNSIYPNLEKIGRHLTIHIACDRHALFDYMPRRFSGVSRGSQRVPIPANTRHRRTLFTTSGERDRTSESQRSQSADASESERVAECLPTPTDGKEIPAYLPMRQTRPVVSDGNAPVRQIEPDVYSHGPPRIFRCDRGIGRILQIFPIDRQRIRMHPCSDELQHIPAHQGIIARRGPSRVAGHPVLATDGRPSVS